MKFIKAFKRARFALVMTLGMATFAVPTLKWQNAEANPVRLKAIERVVGLHERKNRKTIQNMVGINPSTTPWCGAATAYAVRKAGGKPPQYANKALNWSKFGKGVSLSNARKGDVVVMRFKRGYHVALFKKHAGNGRIELCGGNMSDQFKCSSYKSSNVKAVRR